MIFFCVAGAGELDDGAGAVEFGSESDGDRFMNDAVSCSCCKSE